MTKNRLSVLVVIIVLASATTWLSNRSAWGVSTAHAAEGATADAHDHDSHDAPNKSETVESHTDSSERQGTRKEEADHDHGKDAHEDDDHGEEAAREDRDGDEHAHEGHDDEAETIVRIAPEQAREFGVKVAKAGPGVLERRVKLPGEILINSDRAAQIVPRAEGIVREVLVHIGDALKAGQPMAVVESAELSDAQSHYLAKLNEINCCTIDLARAEALQESLQTLLATLNKTPALDDLLQLKFVDAGEGHSKLVAAYAESVLAKSVYEREKGLASENVASQADLQEAASAYKKAYVDYLALRDTLNFEGTRAMLEARRAAQNAALEVKAMERQLRVLGLTGREVKALQSHLGGGERACQSDCNDGKCKHHNLAEPKARCRDEELGLYTLRAPFDGVVIEKRIALGEKIGGDAVVFTVADMASVWVDLSIYQKDLPYVRKGQEVHIRTGEGIPDAAGHVDYVFPIVDETTRTCTARVTLRNPALQFRPGLFVSAEVHVGKTAIPVLVPKAAVRRIEERSVVFVPTHEGFQARDVKTGRQSGTHIELVSGLKPGEDYVLAGAFELQAHVVTSGLGAHAGHGH